MAKKSKKMVKKTAKKKVAKKTTWAGTEKTYPKPKPKPMPPVKPKAEPAAKEPETKKNCQCCNELVMVSFLRLCPKCSFEGCRICRKSGNCPTCGTPLIQGV
jgi:hypothetical protein